MPSVIRGSDNFDSEADKGIGNGQTVQTITPVSGTPYTNNTGRTVWVSAYTTTAAASVSINLAVDGVVIADSVFSVGSAAGKVSVCGPVRNGGTYVFTFAGAITARIISE